MIKFEMNKIYDKVWNEQSCMYDTNNHTRWSCTTVNDANKVCMTLTTTADKTGMNKMV